MGETIPDLRVFDHANDNIYFIGNNEDPETNRRRLRGSAAASNTKSHIGEPLRTNPTSPSSAYLRIILHMRKPMIMNGYFLLQAAGKMLSGHAPPMSGSAGRRLAEESGSRTHQGPSDGPCRF